MESSIVWVEAQAMLWMISPVAGFSTGMVLSVSVSPFLVSDSGVKDPGKYVTEEGLNSKL